MHRGRPLISQLSVKLSGSEVIQRIFGLFFGSVSFFWCVKKQQKAISIGFIPATGVGDPFHLLFTQSLQFVF